MHISKHYLCNILPGGIALLQAWQAKLDCFLQGAGASP